MRILYHNRNRLPEDIELDMPATYVSFEELLSRSDIVSIHVPLSEKTRHLIDKKEFDSMKKGAILVNTSRGPIVRIDRLVRLTPR
jgi:glyoxylate reductase